MIVKIYDCSNDFKVCDVCEFVGVLSLDQPGTSHFNPFMMELLKVYRLCDIGHVLSVMWLYVSYLLVLRTLAISVQGS